MRSRAGSALVAAGALACGAGSAPEPTVAMEGVQLVSLGDDVYVDPTASPEQRALVRRWRREGMATVAETFALPEATAAAVIVCITEACQVAFTGPTRRSRATMQPRPAVMINEIGPRTKGTIVHELIHLEIARRSAMSKSPGRLPAWFEEGVATFIGDNGHCPPGTTRPIDDLRRLARVHAWTNFTNQHGKLEPTYCQARDEVGAWVGRRGRRALVEVIDAVIAGREFDDVYGALVVAPSRTRPEPVLVGTFSLADDKSDVRADGFSELGLPDKPFSIALRVKPKVNAGVVVHTAAEPGADGWCFPILGHDTSGRLVAQVLFAPDAKSFLAATGPVLPLDEWSHVAVTWNEADGVSLYVNGTLAARAAPTSAATRHREAPAVPLHLLSRTDDAARCWTGAVGAGRWSGAVEDIRVYDGALQPAQVLTAAKR